MILSLFELFLEETFYRSLNVYFCIVVTVRGALVTWSVVDISAYFATNSTHSQSSEARTVQGSIYTQYNVRVRHLLTQGLLACLFLATRVFVVSFIGPLTLTEAAIAWSTATPPSPSPSVRRCWSRLGERWVGVGGTGRRWGAGGGGGVRGGAGRNTGAKIHRAR